MPNEKVIWITGAGRSGTHLVGMLADGHPEVNAFPLELRIVEDWPQLVAFAATGGQRLPGVVLDRYMLSRYASADKKDDRLKRVSLEDRTDRRGRTFGLRDYLLDFNQRSYGSPGRHFLFHSPGCQ